MSVVVVGGFGQAQGFPCKVVESASGQLGVVASRDIRGGERICSERPLTLTIPAGGESELERERERERGRRGRG